MTDNRDAADRLAFEETGNPLHVWLAILRYSADEPLPDWIRRYLMQGAHELARLTLNEAISPKAAKDDVAGVFGFAKPGYNAFQDFRQWRNDGFVATIYSLKSRTEKAESVKVGLAKAFGITPRQLLKRVANARKTWPK
jgi:hypothetical protein